MRGLAATEPVVRTDGAVGSINQALARIGMSRESFDWPDIQLEPGERVSSTMLVSHRLTTNDIADLKRWVGFDDDAIRNGRQAPASIGYDELPSASALMDATTSVAARETYVDMLRRAYLFGDSAKVAQFYPILNWHTPFTANVIALGRVELPVDTVLEIAGEPAVVMIDQLIFRGGQLLVRCESRIAITSVVGRDGEVR